MMISSAEYAARRQALMNKIGTSDVVILPAAPLLFRNHDASFQFRQNSDFYYLTGFDEPDAVLVLLPNRAQGEYILFSQVKDKTKEIWDGPCAGQEGAKEIYLADESFPIATLEEKLPELLAGREAIHYSLGFDHRFDHTLIRAIGKLRSGIRSGQKWPTTFLDITPTLHEMRLFKSDNEIALMRQAGKISALAHKRVMRMCQPGMYEYQLEAELIHEFMRHGARYPAYTSIVGSGAHSCILHYIKNDAMIEDNDILLVDAGAEFQYYAADITRSFPANGVFSGEQRAIYEIVLAAQVAAIEAVRPQEMVTKPQEIIVTILTQGLVDLGILKGDVAGLIESKAYFPFYMHKSGHWLGLDVHDVGCYMLNNKWRQFAPGMALTIEPGLYLSASIPGLDPRWHNIGIRIEDDLVVTDKGNDVLTHDVPKEINEIEALMVK